MFWLVWGLLSINFWFKTVGLKPTSTFFEKPCNIKYTFENNLFLNLLKRKVRRKLNSVYLKNKIYVLNFEKYYIMDEARLTVEFQLLNMTIYIQQCKSFVIKRVGAIKIYWKNHLSYTRGNLSLTGGFLGFRGKEVDEVLVS